jgi:hypothetical protein
MKKENYINLSVTQEIGVTRLILNTTTCVKDVQSLLHLFVEANTFRYIRIEIEYGGYEGRTGYHAEMTATLSIGQVLDLHQTVRDLVNFIEDLEPEIKVYTNSRFDETKEQSEVPNNYHRKV